MYEATHEVLLQGNPNKKSESIVRQLNNFSLKFASVEEAREKFKEQFGDQVPDCEFALGYFDGSQQAKVWLYTSEYLVAMYNKFPRGGTINLWCDGNHSNGVGQKGRCCRTIILSSPNKGRGK